LTQQQLIEKFVRNPRSMDKGANSLAVRYSLTRDQVIQAKQIAKGQILNPIVKETTEEVITIPPMDKPILNKEKVSENGDREVELLFDRPMTREEIEEHYGIDNISTTLSTYWNKGTASGKYLVSAFIKCHHSGKKSLQESLGEVLKEIKEYAPKYPSLIYPKYDEAHLLVIDPADIHVNKLCSAFETGDEYTVDIAVNRVMDGIKGLIRKASPYNVDEILLIIGNDMLHTDTPKAETTGGTPQNTNVMWYDAYKTAQKLFVDIIELLLTIAPVKVQYDPSNHDYVSGFMLAQTIEAWFHRCPNITFNVSIAHRKYHRYYKNLIGTSHGDGAKETDLALLMAHESKDWTDCPHRYFYIHHIHHKKSKDYMSVCVEALRSPSGTDGWHHRNGYCHSPKAIEAFLHSKYNGQVARFTHLF